MVLYQYRNLEELMIALKDSSNKSLQVKQNVLDEFFFHYYSTEFTTMHGEYYLHAYSLQNIYGRLRNNNQFINILLKILSKQYKELGYYHGDDGSFVQDFPPIRYTLTDEQMFILKQMEEFYADYARFCNIITNNNFGLTKEQEEKILDEIKTAGVSKVKTYLDALELENDIQLPKNKTTL